MKIVRSILNVLLFSSFLLCFQDCGTDEPTELEKLPPATQSGRRTFGCLVDGKAWVIEGITDVQAYYQTGTFSISAGLTNRMFNSVLSIHISDLNLGEKSYLLDFMNRPESNDARFLDKNNFCEYLTTTEYTGSLEITHFDKSNFIISGTFEFEAYSADCDKIVRITDGRFDIYYAP